MNMLKECTWKYDGSYDAWETSCGSSFVIYDGTPIENDMRFCPYCGNTLVVEENDYLDDEEE